jgi:Alpha-N-acetylglucosaminidase (NAGLU) tim-barrel domain/Alpha-N-acetylglucosaminidase (NAGLU) C-terminal domain/Alpha-N-acetylglucosaminidase (NAGLU) N-terminal domain
MADKNQQQGSNRREFLRLSGGAFVSCLASPVAARTFDPARIEASPNHAEQADGVLDRILPAHAGQIRLQLAAGSSSEFFRVSGSAGKIVVQGATRSSLLMGAHWYLKYVAGVSTSWNGDSLDHLPSTLPAPSEPIERKANAVHRFALNDTNDGYTGPYWSWEQWEKQIDVLALHGINEVLVYLGAEAVYQHTFLKFGFSQKELQEWLPTPAHQPWWVLENLSGWVGPSTPQHVIDARLRLAQRITARLRELGMCPVLPGYYGMVPDGFAVRNAAAHVIPQGNWLGLKRPDWLDPTCEIFSKIASEYYRVQQELLGRSIMFKMDPLHEGGDPGNVNFRSAATAIEAGLQRSHPGAIWAVLGWQMNPRRELLDGIRDKSRVLILDGQADRFAYEDREQQWENTPYAFGTIWNFGGRTTMGANAGVWNERYFRQLTNPNSKLNGIAVMPEASCNNPAAFAFFTELPWRSKPVDLSNWFADWSKYRYGRQDAQAEQAWKTLGATAYAMESGKWSEAHDNLFSARPELTAQSACSWAPKEPRYDLAAYSMALQPLLGVSNSLRNSSAYRYDLVDVARQTLANTSRTLLPRIDAAYQARDLERFRALTLEWLEKIEQLNLLAATEPSLLIGKWIGSARAAAAHGDEQAQLEFDACSLLLEWGPESSRDSGVHDYANREWNGLLEHYRDRWAAYFSALDSTLESGEPAKPIDWFAMDVAWSKRKKNFPEEPQGDFYQVSKTILDGLVTQGYFSLPKS